MTKFIDVSNAIAVNFERIPGTKLGGPLAERQLPSPLIPLSFNCGFIGHGCEEWLQFDNSQKGVDRDAVPSILVTKG